MRVPRVLIAGLLVGAGLLVPALFDPLDARPAGMVGMGHEGYEITGVPNAYRAPDGTPVITIHMGQTISFQNDSRWVHVVGPGKKGLLEDPGAGAMTPIKLMEENSVYTTPPWNSPGTFMITCTVHPDMNAEVVVLP